MITGWIILTVLAAAFIVLCLTRRPFNAAREQDLQDEHEHTNH